MAGHGHTAAAATSRSCCSLQLPVRDFLSARSTLQAASDRAQAPDPAVLEVTGPAARAAWAALAGLDVVPAAVLVVLARELGAVA